MQLDPSLVHPSLARAASRLVRHGNVDGLGLTEPQVLVAETIIALLGSARMPDEMREYAVELNAVLDAEARLESGSEAEALRTALIEPLRAARKAASGLESARSGMAGDICLDLLRLALDDARAAVDQVNAALG